MPSDRLPHEWLLELSARPERLSQLLRDCGSLAVAAWRLAAARCRTHETATDIPSMRELRAAARDIARRSGIDAVPSASLLASECESLGLLVV